MSASLLSLALLLAALVVPSPARADCERVSRVPASPADCLEGGYRQNGPFFRVEARNRCPDLGAIVVKWDIVNKRDKTWTLRSGDWRRDRFRAVQVNGPYCCQDEGHCNRRDRSAPPGPYTVDAGGCRAQWARSGAQRHCTLLSVEFKRGASPWCRLKVRCERTPGATRNLDVYRSVQIRVVDELKWCPHRLPKRALVYRSPC